jgi:hypothetical protein
MGVALRSGRRPKPVADSPERPKNSLPILYPGSCEPLKATVHGVALGLVVLMGAYNTAAWLRRRQRHLAVNAVIYLAAALFEQRHVMHHLRPCLPARALSVEATPPKPEEPSQARAA